MRQETVQAVDGQSIITESGEKICIGDHAFDVGESVWTDGRYAFGNDRRKPAPVAHELGEGTSENKRYFVTCGYSSSNISNTYSFQIFDASRLNMVEIPVDASSLYNFCYNATAKVFALIAWDADSNKFLVKKFSSSGVSSYTIDVNGSLVDSYVDAEGDIYTRFFQNNYIYIKYYDATTQTIVPHESGAIKFIEYKNDSLSSSTDKTALASAQAETCWSYLDAQNFGISESNNYTETGYVHTEVTPTKNMVYKAKPTLAIKPIKNKAGDTFYNKPRVNSDTYKYVKFSDNSFISKVSGYIYNYICAILVQHDIYPQDTQIGSVDTTGLGFDGENTAHSGSHSYASIYDMMSFFYSRNQFFSEDTTIDIDIGNLASYPNTDKKVFNFYEMFIVYGYLTEFPQFYDPSDSNTWAVYRHDNLFSDIALTNVPTDSQISNILPVSYDVGSGYTFSFDDFNKADYGTKITLTNGTESYDLTSIFSAMGLDATLPGSVIDLSSTEALFLPKYNDSSEDYPQFIKLDKTTQSATVIDKYYVGNLNSRMPLISNMELSEIMSILSQK